MCPSDSKQCSFVFYTDCHLPLQLTQQKQRKNLEKLQRERERIFSYADYARSKDGGEEGKTREDFPRRSSLHQLQ